jgi:excisionase family DNA binding protein
MTHAAIHAFDAGRPQIVARDDALDALPLVLTVEEAADVLRIGRSAAYSAVHAGEIPSIKVGRSIRVPRHALAALLGIDARGHSVDTPEKPADLQAVSRASELTVLDERRRV